MNQPYATISYGVYTIDMYKFGLVVTEPSCFKGICPEVYEDHLIDRLMRRWPYYDFDGSRKLAARVLAAKANRMK